MIAPIMAERGSTLRFAGPASIRAIWGEISPTKAMGPAVAVAAPASSITDRQASAQIRRGFSPSVRPRSWPSASASSAGATITLATPPASNASAMTHAAA